MRYYRRGWGRIFQQSEAAKAMKGSRKKNGQIAHVNTAGWERVNARIAVLELIPPDVKQRGTLTGVK